MQSKLLLVKFIIKEKKFNINIDIKLKDNLFFIISNWLDVLSEMEVACNINILFYQIKYIIIYYKLNEIK